MQDEVKFPPLDYCRCPFCSKRRAELKRADRLEREWASWAKIARELDGPPLLADRGEQG